MNLSSSAHKIDGISTFSNLILTPCIDVTTCVSIATPIAMQSSQAHIRQVFKLFDNIFCSVITTTGPNLHFNNEPFLASPASRTGVMGARYYQSLQG